MFFISISDRIKKRWTGVSHSFLFLPHSNDSIRWRKNAQHKKSEIPFFFFFFLFLAELLAKLWAATWKMPPRWTPHWKPISHRERKENIQQYWTVLTSKLFYSLFSVSCSSLLTVWCVAFWLLAQKFFLSLYCLSRHAVFLFPFFF